MIADCPDLPSPTRLAVGFGKEGSLLPGSSGTASLYSSVPPGAALHKLL